MPAELVLKNARVITMDPANPAAGAVAVSGERITLAADNAAAEDLIGPGTRVTDCGGRTVLPGFIDAHCHVLSLVRKLLNVDLGYPAVTSIEEIRQAIRKRAQETPPGAWITGTDYNEFYLAEKRHPTRQDIDEAAPDHPVMLTHYSLHACVLNSRALALAGITGETEAPSGGHIDRDVETGEPNGLCYDMIGHIREKVMPPLEQADLDRGMAAASRHYLSRGITSLQYTSPTNGYSRWPLFRRFADEGLLRSRLSLMCGIEMLDEFTEAGMSFRDGDDRLRLGGAKMVPVESPGYLYPAQPDFNRLVLHAQQAGFQVAIHAGRRETVEAAIIALENAKKEQPDIHLRHRLEHCSECPDEFLERLKKLECLIVSQPPFIYYSGEKYLSTVDADRQPLLYRFRSLIEAGLTVAGSSDSPVVPDNPLVGVYAAVTRRARTGQTVLPEEAVTVEQALRMYTPNAAYSSFDEDVKGSITPGKLADMVVLSDDPTNVPAEQIKDIRVEMTIIGGEIVYEAD